MPALSPKEALICAIEIAGGQPALAQKLDISSMAISYWKKRGVPPGRARDLERITKGRITRQQLRPDLFNEVAA